MPRRERKGVRTVPTAAQGLKLGYVKLRLNLPHIERKRVKIAPAGLVPPAVQWPVI